MRKGLGKGLSKLLDTDDSTFSKEKSSQITEKEKKASSDSAEASKPRSSQKKAVKEEKQEDIKEQTIKISLIEPNSSQPRQYFDEDELNQLADSIKQHGIIEPIVVTPSGKYYEIIAGERRWRAARIAGLKEVPVIVRNYTELEKVEIALIENIQRSDLNPIEEALCYKKLIDNYNLTHDELAAKVSKNRSTISNSLRLLNLCDKVQEMLINGTITTGQARPLIAITDPEIQYETAVLIVDRKMSAREAEKLVKKLLDVDPEKYTQVNSPEMLAIYKDIENNLKNALGAKTKIVAKAGNKGKIEIEYHSNDELDRIINLLYSVR